MPLTRYYIAASADGFVAEADGGVAWLERFTDDSGYGYAPFYEAVGTLIMGRATYDQVREFGDWPYDDKPALIVTGRPVEDAPHAGISAIRPDELVARVRDMRQEDEAGDIWIVGGPASTAPLLAAGLVDQLEISVMPQLLGNGIRLFPEGGPAAPLKLLSHQAYADGVISLTYATGA
jgi:dihydrofolate reductase